MTDSGLPALDDLLSSASVIVVVGPGGVGKTTLSAAMAARAAAEHGRRCLVVTVDPARRLAQAMGIDALTEEPVAVSLDSAKGHLWALMVDMSKSWDELVRRHAPNAETRDRLLDNRLYQTLTRRFAQSHDYIALDHLVDLAEQDRYDLIVVDTPPSAHAMDVLDAPDRMIEFFGSRLLRWITAPYRSRVVNATAKPFLAVAERLLGGEFLAEVTEFFWTFSSLQPAFVRRANLVNAKMMESSTRYVVVRTLEDGPAQQATTLVRELERRGHRPSMWLTNRVLPSTAEVHPEHIEADDLADAMTEIVEQAAEQQAVAARNPLRSAPEYQVPWQDRSVHDVASLRALIQ